MDRTAFAYPLTLGAALSIIALAAAFLGKPYAPFGLAGVVLIVVGVGILYFPRRRERRQLIRH